MINKNQESIQPNTIEYGAVNQGNNRSVVDASDVLNIIDLKIITWKEKYASMTSTRDVKAELTELANYIGVIRNIISNLSVYPKSYALLPNANRLYAIEIIEQAYRTELKALGYYKSHPKFYSDKKDFYIDTPPYRFNASQNFAYEEGNLTVLAEKILNSFNVDKSSLSECKTLRHFVAKISSVAQKHVTKSEKNSESEN